MAAIFVPPPRLSPSIPSLVLVGLALLGAATAGAATAGAATAGAATADEVTPANHLATTRLATTGLPPHPRLRVTDDDLARIRATTASDPEAGALLANISRHADYLLSQPVPSFNDTALLCDPIRDHVYTLGLLYRLATTNKEYRAKLAARAAAELVAVAGLQDWHPARFLTVAETMHAVAIGYDWFYEALTPSQRTIIEDGLVRNGLGVGAACWKHDCIWVPGIAGVGVCSGCWWIKAPMNWNIVGNGGMTIAALALADVPRYASLAQAALANSNKGIEIAVAKYSDSGAWHEGPGYWTYATKYLVVTSETLDAALGAGHGYFSRPGVNATALFALQTHATPSTGVWNFGDAEEQRDPLTVPDPPAPYWIRYASNLFCLANAFSSSWRLGHAPAFVARTELQRALLSVPHAVADATPFWDEVAMGLVRWDARGSATDLGRLPHQAVYADRGFMVQRSGWTSKDAYLGVKGGDSSTTHQDLDAGSFVWETGGYRWAIDLGAESYALPGMFLPYQGRYSYYRKATRGHNTLAFGDPGGFDPADGEASDQAINVFSSLTAAPAGAAGAAATGPGRVLAVVNLTNAYSRQLPPPSSILSADILSVLGPATVQRTFAADPASNLTKVTVTDTVNTHLNPGFNVTWGMHTRATIDTAGAGGPASATLHAAEGRGNAAAPTALITYSAVPADACGVWQAAPVVLPSGRFPVRGANKLWVTCNSSLMRIDVTLWDQGTVAAAAAAN
eukprot:g2755.t1